MSVNFFDSNIFVYAVDSSNPEKTDVANKLIDEAINGKSGVISFQVVQETLNTMTKKFNKQVNQEQRNTFLDIVLMPLWKVMPSRNLYINANAIKERYQYGFYDSLIVAAALEAGCNTLFSEDLQHGQVIDGMYIINPFLEG